MQNINHQEVEKFSEQAARWWDPKGPLSTLHAINPLRLSYIKRFVTLAKKPILDFGSGAGILTEALAKEQGEVTGIDASAPLIQVAKHHAESQNLPIDYECTTIEAKRKAWKEKFSVVTCMELLEHVPNPEVTVSEVASVLAPQGYAFFSTISRTPKAFLFAIVAGEYVLGMLPRGTHSYKKFIRPSELDSMAGRHGLRLIDQIGMIYRPIDRSFALKPNQLEVNYLAVYRKEA